MDDSSIGPGGVRGGPSFRTMSKQDYLLLYDGIHTLLKEAHVLESIQYSVFLSKIHKGTDFSQFMCSVRSARSKKF